MKVAAMSHARDMKAATFNNPIILNYDEIVKFRAGEFRAGGRKRYLVNTVRHSISMGDIGQRRASLRGRHRSLLPARDRRVFVGRAWRDGDLST